MKTKTMRNLGLLVILLTTMVVMTGCVEIVMHSGGQIEYKEYDERIFEAKDTFSLSNFNGKIQVLPATDGQIKVQYSKILRGDEEEVLAEAAKKIEIVENETGNGLQIEAKQPYPRPSRAQVRSMRVEFRIYLPRETRAEIETKNGEINISGLRADLKAKTSNGQMTVVEHRGSLELRSKNGQIALNDVQGDMDVDTSNGQISLKKVIGPVRAESSNGQISVDEESVLYGADLHTSNGKIDFRGQMVEDNMFKMHTSNGEIAVYVDPMQGYLLDAETGNGRIRFDFPYTFTGESKKSSMRGRLFGGGDIVLDLQSSNGSIIFYSL